MVIFNSSGLKPLGRKGNAAIPLIHRISLQDDIKGHQLLSQYAELPIAVDTMIPVP
jgi:hypothetical protein